MNRAFVGIYILLATMLSFGYAGKEMRFNSAIEYSNGFGTMVYDQHYIKKEHEINGVKVFAFEVDEVFVDIEVAEKLLKKSGYTFGQCVEALPDVMASTRCYNGSGEEKDYNMVVLDKLELCGVNVCEILQKDNCKTAPKNVIETKRKLKALRKEDD